MIRRVRLQTQIYIPSPKRGGRAFAPSERRFRPFSPEGRGGFGKPGGGLWTSTFATHEENGWFGWCMSEQPDWLHRFGYLLEPTECRVWEIATRQDHDEFHDRYARPHPFDRDRAEWNKPLGEMGLGVLSCRIDWQAVLEDCDAVRLVNPWEMRWGGAPDGRWAHTITFYGWDCESTWWSKWLFTKVKKIRLRDVACSVCKGTGWEVPPDYSQGIGKMLERSVECPACNGSGRRPSE